MWFTMPQMPNSTEHGPFFVFDIVLISKHGSINAVFLDLFCQKYLNNSKIPDFGLKSIVLPRELVRSITIFVNCEPNIGLIILQHTSICQTKSNNGEFAKKV